MTATSAPPKVPLPPHPDAVRPPHDIVHCDGCGVARAAVVVETAAGPLGLCRHHYEGAKAKLGGYAVFEHVIY